MNLLNLLGQAVNGAGFGIDDDEEKDPNNRIVVEASRNDGGPTMADLAAPDVPVSDPRPVLSDRSGLRPPTREQQKEIVPRSGIFGLKGTFRDVLGYLGDGLLMASGEDAAYMPKRREEKKADALFGMTGGPKDQREAIERYTQFDPEGGREMYDKYQQQMGREAALEGQNKAREALNSDRIYTNKKEARAQIARWYAAAGDDPAKQAVAGQYAKQLIEMNEFDPMEFGLDDDGMTAQEMAVTAGGDMTVNQIRNLPLAESRTRQGERRTDLAEDTFDEKKKGGMFQRPPPRPPAGRQPRSQTALEYYQAIDAKPPSKRTEGERNFYKKFGTGGGKSSRLDGLPPPPPAKGAPASRFRRVN